MNSSLPVDEMILSECEMSVFSTWKKTPTIFFHGSGCIDLHNNHQHSHLSFHGCFERANYACREGKAPTESAKVKHFTCVTNIR